MAIEKACTFTVIKIHNVTVFRIANLQGGCILFPTIERYNGTQM